MVAGSETDGSTDMPRCSWYRSATWRAVRPPCCRAISLSTGSWGSTSCISALPSTNGRLATTAMPTWTTVWRRGSLEKYGWLSTCTTAGWMRAVSTRLVSCVLLKLMQPIARTSPASTSASIAFHVSASGTSPFFLSPKPVTSVCGQWMLYRSRYASCSAASVRSHASRTSPWSVRQSRPPTNSSPRVSASPSPTPPSPLIAARSACPSGASVPSFEEHSKRR